MRLPTTLVWLGLIATGVSASAQSAPVSTFTVGTKLVEVSATVSGQTGQPITGLTREDFILKQDAHLQAIRYFSEGSDLPLTLALIVDTSGSQHPYIPDEINAGRIFFRTMLTRPEDRAVLVQVDCDVQQYAKFTSSIPVLDHALGRLSERNSNFICYGRDGGSRLYDALYATAHIELNKEPGRRAMVILTDGGDSGSRYDSAATIEAAQRGDMIIYSVYYSTGIGGRKDLLEELSDATGGRVFTVSPTMSLQQIFAEISNEMRLRYQLAYHPPDSRPGRYHKIDLKTKDAQLVVEARKGYYTPK